MEVDRSIRKADRIVVFAMVMVLVGCGAIGIATGGSPFDASEWPTVSTPDMATPPDYGLRGAGAVHRMGSAGRFSEERRYHGGANSDTQHCAND